MTSKTEGVIMALITIGVFTAGFLLAYRWVSACGGGGRMSDVPDAYDKLEHEREIFRGWDGVTERDCFHTLSKGKRDVLLSLWRIGGGKGVDVQSDISDMRDGKTMSQPGVYNSLRELEEDNLVSKQQGEDGRTKHYQLTFHGKEVLQSGAARFVRD